MKQLFFLAAFVFSAAASPAQFVLPAEVTQRLGADKSFSRYAYETMRYVRAKQDSFAGNPAKKAYYEKQEKFLARQLWYLESRQDNLGNIFNYTAKTQDEITKYQPPAAPDNTESANGFWSLVGPTNNVASVTNAARGQGRVDRIAFHPTDPNTVYAGTPAGGLWRSLNGGTSWASVNSFMPSLGVSGIVVSWADPNDLYVLTGDGDSNGGDNFFVQGFDYIRPSIGVLKSTDGGLTWNKTGDFGIAGFYTGYKLIQSPTNASLLIAATSQGLYRTTNGGASWTLVSPNTDRYFDVEWKPGSSLRVYAATSENFYISINAGAGFTNQNNNFDIAIGDATRIAIAVTPANANYVYVFAGYSPNSNDYNKGVYQSTNSGDAFTRRSADNALVSSASYMHNIGVSSTNENVVITGSVVIFRSTNGGTAFTQVNQGGDASLNNYAHADVHEIAFNPLDGDLYIGTDGGVHKSTDGGLTLTTHYNMANTQFYHFNVSELDNDIILAGAQDNGTMLRPGATSVFSHFTSGDGYEMEFYHNTAGPAYFSVNKGLYKSNAAITNYDPMTGIPDDWYKTIAISYFNNSIAYTSSGSIYKTTNGGTSWTNMGGSGRWAMITSPSNSNRVYASGGDSWNDGGAQANKKMQRSDDAGSTWIDLQENTGFPETITKITGIAVDPNNSSRIWVTMGGFTDGQKVYYSTNAGGTWTNITGSLPNVPVNCVAVDDNLDAYIGTDIGVFFKTLTMTDWQPFYNFMPRVPVTELHIRGTAIYAGTFGRGIYKSETHTDCAAVVTLNSNMFGYRFYEALNINSSSTLTGGDGTQIFYKAQNAVTLTENFRANASTGESFRAWIANCNSGGIPTAPAWAQTAQLKAMGGTIEFTMPFDAKASLAVLDESGAIKKIIAQDEIFRKGPVKINKTNGGQLKGKLVLLIDGKLCGQLDL
jgi:photosystem II stability/assembly factor-like uncharacterized protein